MVPSHKWFPMNLQERAGWYGNFNNNMQTIGASVGFSPAELDSINKDTENIVYVARAAVRVEAYAKAINAYRKAFTEGDIGDATPGFPADPGFVLPHPAQPAGAFERLDNYVRRIRASPLYTDTMGALLGIIPRQREIAAPDEAAPELTAKVAAGNEITVKFIRGRSDGIHIDANVDAAGWTDVGRFVKSPAVFTVPQNEARTPRGVEIRARYLDGNDPVGDLSSTVTVQTIP